MELIRKLTVDSSIKEKGLSYTVGKSVSGNEICKIVKDETQFINFGKDVFYVRIKTPDEDNPNFGGIYKWKEVKIGMRDTYEVEYDTKSF